MKFLLIASFYDDYLRSFPVVAGQTSRDRVAALLRDAFGMGHMCAAEMAAYGWEPETVICNDSVSQEAWCRENGTPSGLPMREIVSRQIATIRPDVLYSLDPITYDSSFLRALPWRPPLVAAWRSAPIPTSTDVSEFDLLLTNTMVHARILQNQGARRVEWHLPGFRRQVWEDCRDQERLWDLSFSGQWSDDHKERNRLLLDLAKIPLRTRRSFSLGYHLFKAPSVVLPAGVAMHDQGARWGLSMFRALRSGRTTLHLPLDMAESNPGAMRIFEATGMGVPLFVNRAPELSRYFEPDVEVLTYATADELSEKLAWLLEHPADLERIGDAGQARCFRDYAMEVRAGELDAILREAQEEKGRAGRVEARLAPELGGPERKKRTSRHQEATAKIVRPASTDGTLSHSGPAPAPEGRVILEERFPGVGFGNHVQILGVAETSIGEGSIVGDDSWVNVAVRDGSPRAVVGRCVCVGRHNTISTAGHLEIGDYCLFGPQVYISDVDHGFADPLRPYVAQPVTSGRFLVVEENCWIGFGAVVTGGVTVGRGSVVGANSVVNSDVEPFSVVVGAPARVVKMYDPVVGAWASAATEEERSKIREHRQAKPLPARDEYRRILWESGLREITPLAAGGDRIL